MRDLLQLSSPRGKRLPSRHSLHHLSLYSSTPGAASVLANVPAIQDPAVSIVNTHPIFPVPVQLICSYAGGALTLTAAQLTTPKLRAINNVQLRPIDPVVNPSPRPPLVEYFHHPLSLNPIDENQVLASTSAIAATPLGIAMWYGDGNFNVPMGDMFSIAFTATITGVAAAWTTGTLALTSPLPAGRYAVIGAEVYGGALSFFNLVFPNQVWRPGGIGGGTTAYIASRYLRWGSLGVWGEFETFAIPQLSVYDTTGGAITYNGVMDIVRIK
jgi:hypothetical protein